jgi:ferrochelatase
MNKKGLMICNIGTPDHHDPKSVGSYLREFLMDEEIITLPYLARFILVNIGIVPRRKYKSAANYKKIWTEMGSPLMVYSEQLKNKLQQDLGEDTVVEIGMRYGRPSIALALKKFHDQGIREVTILPLYPQYARASTESTFKKVDEVIRLQKYNFNLKKIISFYNAADFIRSSTEVAEKFLTDKKVDHYLMTYHGLPESQDQKMAPENTYRQQCIRTSELIAAQMGLDRSRWSFSFQSRVGLNQWIKPYTDYVLKDLAQAGVKNLAVLCPSFVSDCLETIDEIGAEGAEIFKQAGGGNFYLVPCLNERSDYLVSLLK